MSDTQETFQTENYQKWWLDEEGDINLIPAGQTVIYLTDNDIREMLSVLKNGGEI